MIEKDSNESNEQPSNQDKVNKNIQVNVEKTFDNTLRTSENGILQNKKSSKSLHREQKENSKNNDSFFITEEDDKKRIIEKCKKNLLKVVIIDFVIICIMFIGLLLMIKYKDINLSQIVATISFYGVIVVCEIILIDMAFAKKYYMQQDIMQQKPEKYSLLIEYCNQEIKKSKRKIKILKVFALVFFIINLVLLTLSIVNVIDDSLFEKVCIGTVIVEAVFIQGKPYFTILLVKYRRKKHNIFEDLFTRGKIQRDEYDRVEKEKFQKAL